MSVVSIDDRPTVETDADKARDALLDLVESFKTKALNGRQIIPAVHLQSFIMAISRSLFQQRRQWSRRMTFAAGTREMCCTIC